MANRLNEEATPHTVLVFPADYAQQLAENVRHTVTGLADGQADAETIREILPQSGLVAAVLEGQDNSPTAGKIRKAIEQTLYRIYRSPGDSGSATFGKLHLKQYVVGPETATLQPVDAAFDNGVELLSAGVLDGPQPSGIVRVILNWQAREPGERVRDQFRFSCRWTCRPESAMSWWASTMQRPASGTFCVRRGQRPVREMRLS